jgi:ankyrin repeat protein
MRSAIKKKKRAHDARNGKEKVFCVESSNIHGGKKRAVCALGLANEGKRKKYAPWERGREARKIHDPDRRNTKKEGAPAADISGNKREAREKYETARTDRMATPDLVTLLRALSGAAASSERDAKVDRTTPLLEVASRWHGDPTRQAALVHKLKKRLDADPALDVNARGRKGKTALQHLVKKRCNAAARFLMERGGADPLAADDKHRTPLMIAVSGAAGEAGTGTALFVGWAIRHMRARSPESAAAVQRALDETAMPGAPGSFPSLLVMALLNEENSDALVDVLLACGASPQGAPGSTRTPLHIAVNQCKHAAVRMLLERGADPNAVSPVDGATPLLMAVIKDDARSIGMLMARGADPNARMADNVGSGKDAWRNKNAPELARLDGNSALAEGLAHWAALTAPADVTM